VNRWFQSLNFSATSSQPRPIALRKDFGSVMVPKRVRARKISLGFQGYMLPVFYCATKTQPNSLI
jgi:hypothetical protein